MEQRVFRRPAVAGCDLLLQPVLRSDRLAGRQPGGAERVPDRQPVERARARRGVIGRASVRRVGCRWPRSYTYLDSAVLSLNGSTGLAPLPFSVGQELIRRPGQFRLVRLHLQPRPGYGECDRLLSRLRPGRRSDLWRIRGPLSRSRICQHGDQPEHPPGRGSDGLRKSAQRARTDPTRRSWDSPRRS